MGRFKIAQRSRVLAAEEKQAELRHLQTQRNRNIQPTPPTIPKPTAYSTIKQPAQKRKNILTRIGGLSATSTLAQKKKAVGIYSRVGGGPIKQRLGPPLHPVTKVSLTSKNSLKVVYNKKVAGKKAAVKKPNAIKKEKKIELTQEALDKELEGYIMKDSDYAARKLDEELDEFMQMDVE